MKARTLASKSATEVKPPSEPPTPKEAFQKIRDYAGDLRPLPIGWSDFGTKFSELWSKLVSGAIAFMAFIIASKIVGWLMTAAAISLGAPFWFDLLSMFMKIRGTGDKPKTTKEAKA